MPRIFMLCVVALLFAGCGDALQLANQTKTVAAPREEVFKKMFGTDGAMFRDIPLVTNGGSNRLYELVLERNDPRWSLLAPKERPEAQKIKLAVTMEIPRETHIVYSVDDGALQTGLKFTFEELEPGKTRVAFTIDDLTGHDAEGMAVNTVKLHALARDALNKLDEDRNQLRLAYNAQRQEDITEEIEILLLAADLFRA